MEFKSLKNIETSFRQIRLFGIIYTAACALVVVCSVVCAFRFAEAQRQKIYVLDGGKSLMLALSQDLSQNRPAEAKEHVRRFHELFFTLSPEKSAIEHNAPCCWRTERVQLLRRLCGKRLLQPHHRGQHQPSASGGQRGVRLRPLSLRGADVCPPDDYPRKQRDGTQPCHLLPPPEREPLGRQPERLHHRGLHGIGEQGHQKHGKVGAYGKDENSD